MAASKPYRIVIVGLADGRPTTVDGMFLRSCDVDANGGRGSVIGTADPAQAMTFPDFPAAAAYWRRQSTVTPIRPDGKPNRPLTAYTVTMEPVP